MTGEPLYTAAPGIETSQAGSRVVLFNPATGGATILNATGSLLWSRLGSPQTAEDLAAFLGSEYPELGPERAAADTRAFLESLLGAGLITTASAAGRA